LKRIQTILLGLLLCLFGAGKGYGKEVEPGTVLWEFSAGGSVKHYPAIGHDGTVYVAAGYPDKKVYALNGKTGAKIGEFETGGQVVSSPSIGADGTVYVGSWDKKIYAFKKNGDIKWVFSAEKNGGEESRVFSTPAIGADGTVYIGAYTGSWDSINSTVIHKGKVYALDGQVGVKKWEFETGGYCFPSIGDDGTVYVGSMGGNVYALEGKSGTKKWEFTPAKRGTASYPAIGYDGTIYVASDKVYALDGETGAKKWESFDAEEGFGGSFSSPVVGFDGTIYVNSDTRVYASHPHLNAPK